MMESAPRCFDREEFLCRGVYRVSDRIGEKTKTGNAFISKGLFMITRCSPVQNTLRQLT